jgi:ribosomal protein L40E|tara:strand:- start:78 stop:260 length:183 start_codon:yes stop_codon:yes gene_type:complete
MIFVFVEILNKMVTGYNICPKCNDKIILSNKTGDRCQSIGKIMTLEGMKNICMKCYENKL